MALLEAMPPFLAGGSTIETVTMAGTTFAPPPARFEGGTPPITEAIGLGAAVDYLTALGMENVHRHEQEITAYALEGLKTVPGLRIIGPSEPVDRGGAVAFTLPDIHPHDISQLLDSRGIAVRGGHHCARPLHKRLGVQASTRASGYLYTTVDEIERLADALDYTRDFFGGTR